MRPLFLALLCVLGAATLRGKEKPPNAYTIPLPPKPDYSALDWLVGEWVGKTTDHSPKGDVQLSVAYALENRFMILKEEISLAATKTAPASRESWMGIMSADPAGAGFRLRAFSSTGFVILYRVIVEGGEIHFNPEGGDQPPPGWLFRRVIQRADVGEINESVQAAPPNKLFFDYYTARLTRQATQPANPPKP